MVFSLLLLWHLNQLNWCQNENGSVLREYTAKLFTDLTRFSNTSSNFHGLLMHQSIPAESSPQPRLPPPPGLLWGICPPFQSRGWGIWKFCADRGPGISQPRETPFPQQNDFFYRGVKRDASAKGISVERFVLQDLSLTLSLNAPSALGQIGAAGIDWCIRPFLFCFVLLYSFLVWKRYWNWV